MILQIKTLEKLRDLINEETEYRSGHKLVSFFNQLGSRDQYGQGFPSRWKYTDDKLIAINGSPDLDKCIKSVFSPVNFVGNLEKLDKHIEDFNNYLLFDGWKIVRKGKDVLFQKAKDDEFEVKNTKAETADDFLKKEFSEIPISKLGLDGTISIIIEGRLEEIKKSLDAGAYLGAIFLCGSTLEGVLLGIASKNPRKFNEAVSAPKNKEGKVKPIHEWTLSNLIDVSHEIKLLHEDVKKYSHTLRDFRNYIHPFQQLSSQFNPSKYTASISWQVLRAGLHQIADQNSLFN